LEHLNERSAKASRYVPINVAHVVAKLVFSHLRESHTPAFEGRVVLSREDVATKSAGFYFNFPYLFKQFERIHLKAPPPY